MGSIPEALYEDFECEELHGANLYRSQVGHAHLNLCSDLGNSGKDLQFVLFSVQTFDCLDTLYGVCDVLEGQMQFVCLFICSDRQSMRRVRFKQIDDRNGGQNDKYEVPRVIEGNTKSC